MVTQIWLYQRLNLYGVASKNATISKLHQNKYLSLQYIHILGKILQCFKLVFPFAGPPSTPTLSCISLSENVSGAVNVTVSWTLSGGDSVDFYLISITTNAPQTPYGGLLNITTAGVTQHELTGFMTGYEYNITVRGVNCGSQEGTESVPLTIRPQGA